MIHEFGRKGSCRRGLYDYPEGGKKQNGRFEPWKKDIDVPEQEMIDRFVCAGFGCPALPGRRRAGIRCRRQYRLYFRHRLCAVIGGALQFLNQYGLEKALLRANTLQAKYGERFKAPQMSV